MNAHLSVPRAELAAFCQQHGIRRLALFGSAQEKFTKCLPPGPSCKFVDKSEKLEESKLSVERSDAPSALAAIRRPARSGLRSAENQPR